MGLINSKFASGEISFVYENFLNNGLEREFYTFLDEPVSVEERSFPNAYLISDLGADGFFFERANVDFSSSDGDSYRDYYILNEVNIPRKVEKYFRAFYDSRRSFLKYQKTSKKIGAYLFDGEGSSGVSFLGFSSFESDGEKPSKSSQAFSSQENYDKLVKSNCDPSGDGNAFSEAFISKNTKIIYCLKY